MYIAGVDPFEKRNNSNVRSHLYFIHRQQDGIVEIQAVMFKNVKSIMATAMVSQNSITLPVANILLTNSQ